jgi:hypothetical protein
MARIISAPTVISCGGRAAENHRRVYRKCKLRNADAQHREDDEAVGWTEPGQKPEFDEYTIVLRGARQVETGRRFIK